MKYVLFHIEDDLGSRIHALIFPERVTHSIVAEGYAMQYQREERKPCHVYSAGFCAIYANKIEALQVRSESLRIEDKKDPALVQRDQRLLNLHDSSGGFFNPKDV